MIPRTKTFEEMVVEFQRAIKREYNIDKAVIKIGIAPELFDQYIIEKYHNQKISPSIITMDKVADARIVPLNKEDF